MRYICLLFCLCVSCSLPAKEPALDDYKLGPDDEVSVTVFGEPDLSIDRVKVSTAGNISISLIGQVPVLGLTIQQVEQTIEALFLDGFLKKPNVSVSILEYRQFYINGEVRKPGGYSYRKGVTVQKAVALAGGFTERASKDKIVLVREASDGGAVAVTLSDEVRPGDVITVDESFF